jgi:hypothetical protein
VTLYVTHFFPGSYYLLLLRSTLFSNILSTIPGAHSEFPTGGGGADPESVYNLFDLIKQYVIKIVSYV